MRATFTRWRRVGAAAGVPLGGGDIARTTYPLQDLLPKDPTNRIVGVGGLFGWTEWEEVVVGEIEDGANYYVEVAPGASRRDSSRAGRPQIPPH